jgi:transposase
VVQAPAPPALVEGGRYGFGFAAQVLTNKFADHLPLYREQDIFARAGLELSRSTLCGIVKNAGELLERLAEFMKQRLLTLPWLGADDTPVRLLDPSHPDGIRTARFW